MSYILDALKKAESERNLGAVPNVYANAPHAAETDDGERWKKILPWSLAALALGIALIVLAWLQPWHAQSIPAAPTPLPPSPAVPITATAPPVAPAEPTTTGTPVTAVPAVPTVTTSAPAKIEEKPAQVKPAPAPAAMEKPVSPPSEKKIATTPKAKEEKPVAKAEQKPEPKPEAPAEIKPEPRNEAKPDGSDVGMARDLPQAIQSQLPAISVNGYLYVREPADRSVLMNQKLLHEGDTVAPDLVLEKLLPKGAILNYKGYRYRIAF